MGIPEDEAEYYEGEVRSRRTLVTVRADGRYDDARAIMQRAGAYAFETRNASRRACRGARTLGGRGAALLPPDWERRYGRGRRGRWDGLRAGLRYTWEMRRDHALHAIAPGARSRRSYGADWEVPPPRPPMGRFVESIRDAWERRTNDVQGREGERIVELREEELPGHQGPVETGEVRVGKEVVTRQETLNVPVTREEVVVARHPVEPRPSNRPVGQEQTIEVPVREERVEVEQPVVYEEVEVGKRQVQETEQVSGTVRREEVRVEREGDVDVRTGGTGAAGSAAGTRSGRPTKRTGSDGTGPAAGAGATWSLSGATATRWRTIRATGAAIGPRWSPSCGPTTATGPGAVATAPTRMPGTASRIRSARPGWKPDPRHGVPGGRLVGRGRGGGA